MTAKTILIPGPRSSITIERNPRRLTVTLAGHVIADTIQALTLREASYPPVQYIPRQDVDMGKLVRSQTTSYCPYKGDASYFSIDVAGRRSVDANVDL